MFIFKFHGNNPTKANITLYRTEANIKEEKITSNLEELSQEWQTQSRLKP